MGRFDQLTCRDSPLTGQFSKQYVFTYIFIFIYYIHIIYIFNLIRELILLMEEILHQLRLVVYPFITGF